MPDLEWFGLYMQGQQGVLPLDTVKRNLELFATKVIPEFQLRNSGLAPRSWPPASSPSWPGRPNAAASHAHAVGPPLLRRLRHAVPLFEVRQAPLERRDALAGRVGDDRRDGRGDQHAALRPERLHRPGPRPVHRGQAGLHGRGAVAATASTFGVGVGLVRGGVRRRPARTSTPGGAGWTR